MRVAVLGAALAGGLGAGGAAFAADIGANDDTPRFQADGGAAIYAEMAAAGLKETVLTLRFTPSRPLDIPARDDLARTIGLAVEAGLRPVLATYPYPPAEVELGLATPELFGAWLGEVAAAFPAVKTYVVGNEPNQPAFIRPQFDASGGNASAALAGALLAAGYDALKAVDPTIVVVGVGLSPRGNDRPNARSNISTSPMRFLRALGDWYRASGRTLPLMDRFSFHPYPNAATDPLERGYPWPNVGFVNLDRLKQGLWDAFEGTPQPTTVTGLRISLDEVGWQVDTTGLPGYLSVENVPVTSEAAQSAIYGELVRRAMCDLDVSNVNVFGFRDDAERAGFQAGLTRVDGTARDSLTAVRLAAAETACVAVAPWRPLKGVAGAVKPPLVRTSTTLTVTPSAAEGATALACVLSGRLPLGVVRTRLDAATSSTPGCTVVPIVVNRPVPITLPRPPARTHWTLGLRVVAETSAKRLSTWSYT
jgi:hypothetical protein